MRLLILIALALIAACVGPLDTDTDHRLILAPANFNDLPGWQDDDLTAALPALRNSCARISRRDAKQPFGPLPEAGSYGKWHAACQALSETKQSAELRNVIESYFQPFEASAGKREEGLFTGYYEASLRGSRTKYGPYRYPLHTRPDDLVMVQLGDFREELKGQRIAGRVQNGNLKPYETRAEIVSGQWPYAAENDPGSPLAWVDSPVDAFFVQIQGSGVIELDDGSTMRIGYAGQNGHVYYAIGRELVKREELERDEVSMESIRNWLEANPDQANEVMNTNRSYVFFRESNRDGAIGGEGVVLTAGRSLAIDRSLIPYGTPLWVEIDPPIEGEDGLQRLMVAQDTGGAIRGAVRGDVYWGYGDRAAHMAGHMKSKGRYWLLLPK